MCPPKTQNKGRGETSGRWEFEEYEFCPGVFGRGVVEYTSTARRIKSVDREVRAFLSMPYEIEISDPVVKEVVIFNDDGDEIQLNVDDARAAAEALKVAFEIAKNDVVDFEMGLL